MHQRPIFAQVAIKPFPVQDCVNNKKLLEKMLLSKLNTSFG